MEKHKPVKELPEDIKQLPREETVCKFCGVSYLVHHEISQLEHRVEQLEQEIKRLKSLEDEKLTWGLEKAKILEELKQVHEGKSRLEDVVRSKEVEVKNWQSQYKTLKEDEYQQKMENQTLKSNTAYVLKGLTSLKTEIFQLNHYRTQVQQLLTNTSASLDHLRQQCSLKCSCFVKHTEEATRQLNSEIKRLQKQLECQKEDWNSIESDLKQLLKKEQDSSQKYKDELHDLARRTRGWESKLTAKDGEVQKLRESYRICKNEAQGMEAELKSKCTQYKKEIQEMENELDEVRTSRTSTQCALENARHELKMQEQNSTAKQKELRASLQSCQRELVNSQKRIEALQFEHSRQLEMIKKEQRNQLESAQRTIKTEQEKILQQAMKSHLSAEQALQAKLTELKSTLSASELEKTRLVSSLQEQLQKEKDIAERELTDHLDTVKALELSLLQEKRAKKELEDRKTTNNLETQQVRECLRSAETKRLDLEKKLSEAYKEISTLQAIVERECEERERLMQELAQAKMSTRKAQKKTPNRKQ